MAATCLVPRNMVARRKRRREKQVQRRGMAAFLDPKRREPHLRREEAAEDWSGCPPPGGPQ